MQIVRCLTLLWLWCRGNMSYNARHMADSKQQRTIFIMGGAGLSVDVLNGIKDRAGVSTHAQAAKRGANRSLKWMS